MITINEPRVVGIRTMCCYPTTWRTGDACFLMYPDMIRSIKIKDFDMISTGKRTNWRGDHNCDHLAANGRLFIKPEEVLVDTTPQPWVYGYDAKRVRLVNPKTGVEWQCTNGAAGLGYLGPYGGSCNGMLGRGIRGNLSIVGRMPRKAGDRLFVEFDYSGLDGEPHSNRYSGTITARYQNINGNWFCSGDCPWDIKRGIFSGPYQFGAYFPDYRVLRPYPGTLSFKMNLQVLIQAISAFTNYAALLRAWRATRDDMYREVLIEALENVRQSSFNGLAYIKDLLELVKPVRQVFSAVSSARKGRLNLRKLNQAKKGMLKTLMGSERFNPLDSRVLASNWVSYRYGLRLFIQDSKSIIRLIENFRKNESRFDATKKDTIPTLLGYVNAVTHIEVFTDDTDSSTAAILDRLRKSCSEGTVNLQHIESALRRFDLVPSFANIWDLIPYSFVVDWLVPVERALTSLDAQRDIQTYHVKGAVWSIKYSRIRDMSFLSNVTGSVEYKIYQRYCLSPDDLLERLSSKGPLRLGGGLTLRNLFTGCALIIQRWAK